MTDADNVISAAIAINGNFQKSLFWYHHEKLAAFDQKTPEALVSEGRTEDLLRYLSSLDAGALG